MYSHSCPLHEGTGGSGGTVTFILNFQTEFWRLVSFTSQPSYPKQTTNQSICKACPALGIAPPCWKNFWPMSPGLSTSGITSLHNTCR
jgi:hypothetical protein